MSRRREVRCTVPVYVTIDGGRITRVVVDDESVQPDEEVPLDIIEILDTEEWPPWEFGL